MFNYIFEIYYDIGSNIEHSFEMFVSYLMTASSNHNKKCYLMP